MVLVIFHKLLPFRAIYYEKDVTGHSSKLVKPAERDQTQLGSDPKKQKQQYAANQEPASATEAIAEASIVECQSERGTEDDASIDTAHDRPEPQELSRNHLSD